MAFRAIAIACSVDHERALKKTSIEALVLSLGYHEDTGSQPVDLDPLQGWKDPSQGSPKTIRKHRHLHCTA